MSKENGKITLCDEVENFHKNVEKFFPEGNENALLLLANDSDYSDGSDCVSAVIRGKRSNLCVAICKLMETNESVRRILLESVAFYKFKNDIDSLTDVIEKALSEIKE